MKYYLIVYILIFCEDVLSQNSELSPYSKYNLSNSNYSGDALTSSMSGSVTSFKKSGYVNIFNPASYSDINSTSKSIGLTTSFLELKNSVSSSSINSVNFSEAIIGIPTGNSGIAIGIYPYNRSLYAIETEQKNNQWRKYKGEGGLNSVFIGYGMQIFENFRLGINIDYIFGDINELIYVFKKNVYINSKLSKKNTLNMINLKIGGLYSFKIYEETDLNIGVVFTSKNTTYRYREEVLSSFFYNTIGGEIDLDTAYTNISNPKNKLSHIDIDFGISINTDKWYLGLDYKWGNPKRYDSNLQNNFYSISLGANYVENTRSPNYTDRIEYRFGLNHNQLPFSLNNKDVTNIGMSMGIGLPLGDNLSSVNISLDFGQLGQTDNKLIKENYLNLHISILLNDIWFIKRMID